MKKTRCSLRMSGHTQEVYDNVCLCPHPSGVWLWIQQTSEGWRVCRLSGVMSASGEGSCSAVDTESLLKQRSEALWFLFIDEWWIEWAERALGVSSSHNARQISWTEQGGRNMARNSLVFKAGLTVLLASSGFGKRISVRSIFTGLSAVFWSPPLRRKHETNCLSKYLLWI